ncbi:MAG: hypothetical protein Q8O89_02795 [Nanoarchaeota archaeon]|nr:hypothetical protein [Nanoarchaeota archaeon]
MKTQQKIKSIYEKLLCLYGQQGWWPIITDKSGKSGKSSSKYLCEHGLNAPRNDSERFEICVGAILTQNTGWYPNVVNALINLKRLKAMDPKKILKLDDEKLKQAIRPAGYFNQKAKKLKEFCRFYMGLNGRNPSREALLNIWGIGPETADSMLLYAYDKPIFVVDAYTKRIFSRLGFFKEDAAYDEVQKLFMNAFKDQSCSDKKSLLGDEMNSDESRRQQWRTAKQGLAQGNCERVRNELTRKSLSVAQDIFSQKNGRLPPLLLPPSVKIDFQNVNELKTYIFKEYHALIVEHAKRHCKTNADCDVCLLKSKCEYV